MARSRVIPTKKMALEVSKDLKPAFFTRIEKTADGYVVVSKPKKGTLYRRGNKIVKKRK